MFPAANKKVFAALQTPEEVLAKVEEWCDHSQVYLDKYAVEAKMVTDKLAEMYANRDKCIEVMEAGKAENVKPECLLVLTTKDVDEIRTEIGRKRKGVVTRKFAGDNFTTTFRIVDGMLMATEPRFPAGRRVWTEAELNANRGEVKITSELGVLRWCFNEYKGEDEDGLYVLYHQVFNDLPDELTAAGFGMCKIATLCVACLLARRNGIVIRVNPEKKRFMFGLTANANKEIVRDLICMFSCLA